MSPIQSLYRRILREHRKTLPFDMRSLGDDYVKAGMSTLHDEVNWTNVSNLFSL